MELSDFPRHVLRSVVRERGAVIYDNPRLCEALLKDLCPEHRKEITILVDCCMEEVPLGLLHSKLPYDIIERQLVKRLQENLLLIEDACYWGVRAWAFALEVTQPLPSARMVANTRKPQARHPESQEILLSAMPPKSVIETIRWLRQKSTTASNSERHQLLGEAVALEVQYGIDVDESGVVTAKPPRRVVDTIRWLREKATRTGNPTLSAQLHREAAELEAKYGIIVP